MEENQEQPSATANPIPNRKEHQRCEECKTKQSKYKCPACSFRSCSLPCVNAHKQRTGCTGKRSVSDIVPLSKFDDYLLLSDYNMLEDVKRVADSAHRMRVKLCGNYQFRLPFPLKNLRNAAANRKIKLLFLSNGMSKRQQNRTYYNNRKKFLSWTLEWRFHSADVVLVDHGVHEDSTLSSVIENHLKPGPWNHQLRKFCDEPLDSLKFFIRKYPKGPKSPFRQLDLKRPLREQLANLCILEYPVIHVYLPSHNYDFEVINDVIIPEKVELKEPVDNGYPSPEGVIFKEEEIRDNGFAEPHVSDLLYPLCQNRGAGKELEEPADRALMARGLREAGLVLEGCQGDWEDEVNNICTGSRNKDMALLDEDVDFNFGNGLVDVRSDVSADINPDDFLMEEELEEGEIAY